MKINDAILFELDGKKLYREKDLIDIYVPIFFVCIDDDSQRYLVICLDDEADEYLIAKVTDTDLIGMLERKVPMRTLFVNSESTFYVKAQGNYSDDIVKKISSQDIEDDDLPTEGALFEIENISEINEYISEISSIIMSFKTQNSFNMKTYSFKNITEYNQKEINSCLCSFKLESYSINKINEVIDLKPSNNMFLCAS